MLVIVVSCPFCYSSLNKVVDKRAVSGSDRIRRRRECLKCFKRFTTYESLATLRVLVIKKDGRREIFDEDKIRGGILKALEKRPSIDKAERIIDKIEGKLRARGIKEIPSKVLGGWVLTELKKVDGVAYLRFASVYRTFQDPKDFLVEAESLA